MTRAGRLEGPRAPLFYSAAALLLLSGTITTAQTVDLAALERCASLESPDRKLACFEAIIAGSKTADTPEPEAVDIAVSDPPVAEIEAVPEAEPPVEVTRREAPAVNAAADSTAAAAVATSTAAVAVTAEPSADPVPVTPEPSTAPDPAANSRLGEEHLDRPDTEKKVKEDEVVHATVTEVTKGRNKVLYFHFDNGQVWRQIEGRHLEYPKNGEFDIKITRGMMGEYRMRIGDNGRLVRIRRVQ